MWCINSTSQTSMRLWRTGERTFRVVQAGHYASMLTNPDYVIFDNKFRPILDKLLGQVNLKSITITDGVKQTSLDNFIEVELLEEVDKDQICGDANEGLRIRKFGIENVFVSVDLMNEFKRLSENEFDFTKGVSKFAGLNHEAD
jgi:hypothetical protein